MNLRTSAYVGLVITAAVACGVMTFAFLPAPSASEWSNVAVLAVLAAVAELLSFALPRASQGSLAFIPYLAAVMVVPSWPTIAAGTLVRFLAEVPADRDWRKKLFNTAQLTLSLAAAVAVFRSFGVEGMLAERGSSLLEITVKLGLPSLAAFLAAFGVNTIVVQGVIALANGEPFRRILRANVLPGMIADVLASPIVFVFAWIFTSNGAIATLAIWGPILGLRQLTKARLELEQTNQELLELMVRSIEARDAYTSGHSRRVRDYSEVVARACGMSERDVEHVKRAALLHDVGKIHEKYAPVLAKPDRLSTEEWQLMQQHPIDGAELVGTMTRLRDLLPAIRHHHERWDGTGYPDALSGGDIPLAARVIALADTIDAMTSERPYRRAMTADELRAEVLRCRGTQFDPQIVDRVMSPSVWTKIAPPAHGDTFRGLAVVREA